MKPDQIRCFGRTLVVASLLTLAGCASLDYPDPAEWMAGMGDVFNTKKKLPGERKPVFPEGVPGVAKGVPAELMRGSQTADAEPDLTQPATPQREPKSRAKPRPRAAPKLAAPGAPAEQPRPTAVTVRPSSASPATAAPWPDPPQQRARPQPATAEWPDPPGAQQRQAPDATGSVWPDPPAPR